MKITTRISYVVDLFPELNVDVGHDGSAIVYGMDDVTVGLDELPALAKFFTEIAEDVMCPAAQWEVGDPDSDVSEDTDDDEQPRFVFMFGDIDGESEDK